MIDEEKTKDQLINELRELRQQKEKVYFEKLQNSLGEAIFTVKFPERVINHVNKSVETIFGYSAEESIGQNTKLFYSNEEGFIEFGNKLKETMESGGNELRTEQNLKRKNGEVFSSEITTTFLREKGQITHVISIVRDITERKQARKKLRESEERFRSLVNSTNDLITTADESGNWTFVSPSVKKILGYEPIEMLGKSAFDFMFDKDIETTSDAHDKVIRDGKEFVEYENRWKHKDGNVITLSWTVVTKVDKKGNIIGTQGIARDTTERKQIEGERETLIAQLQKALAEVKTLKGVFPICASCKKIRDDEGYWKQIEAYIRDHSDAEFSHSICPECAKKLYPEFYKGD